MPKIKIDEIKVGRRHRKDMGDLDSLANSLEEVGLIHPVVITKDKQLIAGQRRLRAATKLGWAEIDTRILDLENLILGERAENVERKDFTPSEAVAIAEAIRPLAEQRAKERQRLSPGQGKKGVQNLHTLKSRQEVASAVGLSHASLKKAEEIVRAAKEQPELFTELQEEMDSSGNIDSPYRKYKRKRRLTERGRQSFPSVPPSEQEYQVLYADPPWKYDNSIENWGPASLHYETMDIESICNLPTTIPLNISPDAVLFLWVTNPFIREGLQVANAWGFSYKTNIVWIKRGLKRPGSGFYVRGRHELLFICTRGSFLPLDNNISPPIGSVVEADIGEHSEKPEEVYNIIERLYPNCSYIELFARRRRERWYSWGNELDG